jgi:hypothetical protein
VSVLLVTGHKTGDLNDWGPKKTKTIKMGILGWLANASSNDQYQDSNGNTQYGRLTPKGVQSQIDHGWPIIAAITYKSAAVDHVVVIGGYSGSGLTMGLTLMDPFNELDPTPGSWPYVKFVDNNLFLWRGTVWDVGKP